MYQAQATKVAGNPSYRMIRGIFCDTNSLVWVVSCLPAVKDDEAVSGLSRNSVLRLEISA